MSNFPTTWTPNPKYYTVEPPEKSNGRFAVCIFVGFVIGFFLSVVTGANIWLPAGGVASFFLCALAEDEG